MGVLIGIATILAFITIIVTPVQYLYLKSVKEMENKNQKKGINQGDMYDSLSFGEQYAHYNAQGNLLFLPANIIADIIYRVRHKKDEKNS